MSIASDDSLITMAHTAFGGHISKGLLRRARAAMNRRCERATKSLRADIFERIIKLPGLWCCVYSDWQEIAEIVYKCIVAADLGDSYDYHSASRSVYLNERADALRHFVERHAGKRLQKKLLAKLTRQRSPFTKEAPQ